MRIRYMKEDALNYFKDNLETYYTNYFIESDNTWMTRAFGSDPFEDFIEVNDFDLADSDNYSPGELELENCKRIYMALRMLTPTQAVDERLWAGLCNDLFYGYLKRRFGNYELHSQKKDLGAIRMRFYFSEKGRSGVYSNPLSKWWWIAKSTFDPNNEDHFERLDAMGWHDFSTKAVTIFGSYLFSSNKEILNGIIDVLKFINDNKIRLTYKKEFRAAMKYLNAYGGGILLDTLTREEVRDILLRKVLELVKNKNKDLVFYSKDEEETTLDEIEDEEELDNFDYELPKEIESLLENDSDENDANYAEYGDVVIVKRKADGVKMPLYQIPSSKEELNGEADIIRDLLGKKVNESFRSMGKEYIVVDIKK